MWPAAEAASVASLPVNLQIGQDNKLKRRGPSEFPPQYGYGWQVATDGFSYPYDLGTAYFMAPQVSPAVASHYGKYRMPVPPSGGNSAASSSVWISEDAGKGSDGLRRPIDANAATFQPKGHQRQAAMGAPVVAMPPGWPGGQPYYLAPQPMPHHPMVVLLQPADAAAATGEASHAGAEAGTGVSGGHVTSSGHGAATLAYPQQLPQYVPVYSAGMPNFLGANVSYRPVPAMSYAPGRMPTPLLVPTMHQHQPQQQNHHPHHHRSFSGRGSGRHSNAHVPSNFHQYSQLHQQVAHARRASPNLSSAHDKI